MIDTSAFIIHHIGYHTVTYSPKVAGFVYDVGSHVALIRQFYRFVTIGSSANT